jgi:tripartite-type tricarboxylate transporter receptor subunit TctC
MTMHRRTVLKALAALPATGFAAPSFAQSYPDRAIKLIVPYLAGGATDSARASSPSAWRKASASRS